MEANHPSEGSSLGFEKTSATLDRMVGKRVDLWISQRGGASQRLHVCGLLAIQSRLIRTRQRRTGTVLAPSAIASRALRGGVCCSTPATFGGSKDAQGGLEITLRGGLTSRPEGTGEAATSVTPSRVERPSLTDALWCGGVRGGKTAPCPYVASRL